MYVNTKPNVINNSSRRKFSFCTTEQNSEYLKFNKMSTKGSQTRSTNLTTCIETKFIGSDKSHIPCKSSFNGDILKNFEELSNDVNILKVPSFKNYKKRLDEKTKIFSTDFELPQLKLKLEGSRLIDKDPEEQDQFENFDYFPFDLRKEIRNNLLSNNYYFNAQYPEIAKRQEQFYNKKENQINFLQDIYEVPNITNNLSVNLKTKTKHKIHKHLSRLHFRENLEHLNNLHIIDRNTKVNLNRLRHKHQLERDFNKEILGKIKFQDLIDKENEEAVEEGEPQMPDDCIYNEYFRTKYLRYQDVNIPKEKEFVKKIDPLQRVKDIAKKMFKGIVAQAIKTNYTFDQIIKNHMDNHSGCENEKKKNPKRKLTNEKGEISRYKPESLLNKSSTSFRKLKRLYDLLTI